jgi:hypothetical protein
MAGEQGADVSTVATVDADGLPAVACSCSCGTKAYDAAPACQNSFTKHRTTAGGGRSEAHWCHQACLDHRCGVGGAACLVRLPVQQGGHGPAVGDRPERPAAEGVCDRCRAVQLVPFPVLCFVGTL